MFRNKSWGKEGESRGHLEWWCLSSEETVMSHVFLEIAEHLPTNWKQWINSLFCCFYIQLLLYPLNCHFLNYRFLHFYLSNSVPYPTRDSKWAAVRGSAAWNTHNQVFQQSSFSVMSQNRQSVRMPRFQEGIGRQTTSHNYVPTSDLCRSL